MFKPVLVLESMFEGITGGANKFRLNNLHYIYSKLSEGERLRLRVEECQDEHTGCRYGKAKCRSGRAVKIGGGGRNRGSRYAYQVWAVWA